MPPSKIDALIDSIGDLREAMGGVRSDIRTLFKQGDKDRDERAREHGENQERMGQIAQAATASISELRDTAKTRWEENSRAVDRLSDVTEQLTRKIDDQGRKLDEHAATVSRQQQTIATLQIGRGKIAFLASVGLLAMGVIWWALDAGLHWALDRVLKMKFGG